jgi:hypothetical protein
VRSAMLRAGLALYAAICCAKISEMFMRWYEKK